TRYRGIQDSGGEVLHADLLPDLRLEGAAHRPRPRLRDRAAGLARRRSRDPAARAHLGGIEGALARNPRRPAALRRGAPARVGNYGAHLAFALLSSVAGATASST